MKSAGGVYAGLAGHDFHISEMKKKETHNFMGVPLSEL
jgi:hypothetical protein